MDILSPGARRRCDCISSQLTLALALFYLMALFIYYSTVIEPLQTAPFDPNYSASMSYASAGTAPAAPISTSFVLGSDFALGLFALLRIFVPLCALAIIIEYLPQLQDHVPLRRRSRDPPAC